MGFESGHEIAIRRFLDHLGQRFRNLLLRVIDVLEAVKEQVLHGFDVLSEQSHLCSSSLLLNANTHLPFPCRNELQERGLSGEFKEVMHGASSLETTGIADRKGGSAQ